jgi:polyisoprenoid-binding protein YceI
MPTLFSRSSRRTSPIPAGTWVADLAHSTVGFSVKHLGIATVRGSFEAFTGELVVGDDLAAGRITASIEATSVNTQEAQRDEHLRSADFFDVAEFPQISFRADDLRQTDDEDFEVHGELTMHGVTRPLVLQASVQGLETDPWGQDRVGIELTGQLSRGDFGMKFNQVLGSGNVLVSDKVKITLDISAIRQQD